MSLENNRKILIGSVIQSLDKRLILGDEAESESVILVSMLIDYIEYAVQQQNLGNESYFAKIKQLNEVVQQLKYKCPDVCIYKNRLILATGNTPPVIDDNVIQVPISNTQQALPYNEVIKNYRDNENDLISQVVILSKDNTNELLIDNNPVIINNIYQPNINFSTKYLVAPNLYYIIKNSDTEPCQSSIIAVDNTAYNTALQTQQVVDAYNADGNTVLQTINNNIEELPNDTIIYVHIDTSSMAVPDQETVRDVTIDWWNQFQIDNPNFEGSLVINTVANDQISTDFAPGRGGNGSVTITGSTIKTGTVEAWVENPAEALLRQAWKEGENTFANEAAFQTWIQDKSVVVLTFVDETHSEYHATDNVGFISTGQNIFQPTPAYITDYNNFLFKVRPFLRFFKGVLYPITRVNNISNDNFQLHALAAMEATILTSAEIDAQFGTDKVTAYGPTNMQTKFYDNLATVNPYSNLNGLKDAGWEGRFDKTSPASDVLNSQEFADELNDILTDTSNVQVSVLETTEIPAQNLGNSVQTNMSLKVRDNNPLQPLFSNEVDITVQFTSECEIVPDCQGSTNNVQTPHKQDYVFTLADFTSDSNVDKVKLTAVNIPNGQLKYFNLTITGSNLPIVIPIADIVAGNLIYVPDNTVQTAYTIDLSYTLSFTGSINYCNNPNVIEVEKTPNPNQPAIIVTEDKVIDLASSTDTGTTTINTTITYTGSGSYVQFWERISGATDVQLLNPTDEDLQLANLKVGNYTFRITVITSEDGFVTTADSLVTVTAPVNNAPTVNDNTLALNFSTDFQANEQQAFSPSSFTNGFTDPDGDSFETVRVTSLPITGELLFNGNPVVVGFEFPVAEAANLTYSVDNVKQEIDGLYVYPFDLDAEIQMLEDDDFIVTNYANGVYTLNKLSEDLIDSGVDGTFDSLPGTNTTFNSNVTGAGWQNGNGTADSVLPNPGNTGVQVGSGVPASSQGGVYAGAISIAGATSREEFFTNIDVIAGETYRVTFEQVFAGDNFGTYPIGTAIPWEVSLDGDMQLSTPNVFAGFGNQVWEEETLQFVATRTANVVLSFKAGLPSGIVDGDNTRYGYLGCDNVRIQQLLSTSTDVETITGQQLTGDIMNFETSDDNANTLFSNEATITIA